MKNEYQTPELEILAFGAEDVIEESDTFDESNTPVSGGWG